VKSLEDTGKSVKAWWEKLAFAECPYCDHIIEYGDVIVASESTEETCEKCGKIFQIEWDDE
jgi:hypothetical protein